MLQPDTITYTIHYPTGYGSTTTAITYNPATVVGFSFLQANVASDTILKCGSTEIYRNFAKDVPYAQANYSCANGLFLSKTGNDEAVILVNYLPYLRTGTSSQAYTSPVFTFGDVAMILLLFSILSVLIYDAVRSVFLPKFVRIV